MTNEEKYRTTDERTRAFWRFCKGQEKRGGCLRCPTKCVPTYRERCALIWLALEAKEEKIDNADNARLKKEMDEAAEYINDYLQEIPSHPKAHNWLIRNGYKDESYQETLYGQEIVKDE